AVRSALQGTDTVYIRRTMQELSDALQKVGQAIYGQQGAPDAGPQGPGAGPEYGQPGGATPPGGDTVEGEFKEV
ncbi:MAG: molecular chaperone DnaK, partial [Chloroflexota bacterium]|nr:molecular chaperone DnaK [Chloroflexota bacterium]